MEPPLGFTVHGVFTIQLRITMHRKKISIRLCILVLGPFNCFPLHFICFLSQEMHYDFLECTRIKKSAHTHTQKDWGQDFFTTF